MAPLPDNAGCLAKDFNPLHFLRFTMMQRCYKIKGFLDLSLSEPHPLKDLERTGWIKFENGTDLDMALKVLSKSKDWQASNSPHRATRPRYTHEIANSEARIRADLELIKSLVKVCDHAMTEKPIVGEKEPLVLDGTALLEARLVDHILAKTEAQEGDQEEGSVTAPKIADAVGSDDVGSLLSMEQKVLAINRVWCLVCI